MHAARKQQRHITREKGAPPYFLFCCSIPCNEWSWAVPFGVPRTPHPLVAMSLPCLLFRCSISWGMNVRERLPSVFLQIRMHWFTYLKNYCSYLVGLSLPCFLFCCSISCGVNVRERLPLVSLEIRVHWFIYLRNYCSYLVAMPFQSCFFWISLVVVSVLSLV